MTGASNQPGSAARLSTQANPPFISHPLTAAHALRLRRKALYNIGKKTVAYFSGELRDCASLLDMPDSMMRGQLKGIKAAHKLASQHIANLEKMLPKAARLHENDLYEACLNTQSAGMALKSMLASAIGM